MHFVTTLEYRTKVKESESGKKTEKDYRSDEVLKYVLCVVY